MKNFTNCLNRIVSSPSVDGFLGTNKILSLFVLIFVFVLEQARSAAAKSALLLVGRNASTYLPTRGGQVIQKQTREAAKVIGGPLLPPQPAQDLKAKPSIVGRVGVNHSVLRMVNSSLMIVGNASIQIRSASSTSDFDWETVHQIASELRDKKNRLSQRVRPHFQGKAVTIPSRKVKNFQPFDAVTPPKGYELLCPKAASFYHIDRPLEITELELRGELKKFLGYLESDKNYIVHLIAQYTPNEIGFRTVMKSFYLSSNVPVKSLQGLIVNSLTAQLEKYQAEELIRLTIRVKESYMMKERGAIGKIIEVSDNVIRKYGYDWATRLKDPSLYPLQHMLKLEELMIESTKTQSPVKQYEILNAMLKIKKDLQFLFNPSHKSETDLILEEIITHPGEKSRDDRIVAIVKEMQDQLREVNLETSKMLNHLKESNKSLAEELRNSREQLSKSQSSHKSEIENLKNRHREDISLLLSPSRNVKSESESLAIAKANAEAAKATAEAEVAKANAEAAKATATATAEVAKANAEAAKAEAAKSEASVIGGLLSKLDLDSVSREELTELLRSSAKEYFDSTDLGVKGYLGQLFDLNNVGKRRYTTNNTSSPDFIFNHYSPGTCEFKWGVNTLVFIFELKKWLVLDSERRPMLTFQDYPDRRVIDTRYILYFETLKVFKHFPYLPTFKCTKSHEPPVNDSFGVWDTESYHSINGNVDTLGLLTLAFKFPGSESRVFYLSDYDNADAMASAFWQTLAAESNGRVLYAHNAPFDYAFTLDSLQNTFGKDNIVILRHKNKIKAIEVILEGQCVLKLHDSAALFYQAGLRDLCVTYSVNNPKTYFPYNFATLETANYIGPIPPYELWSNNHNPDNNCPLEVWSKLPHDNWNLREELVKYMVQDLIALEQVLTKHAKYIFDNFGINLHNILTAPGMSKYLMFQEQYYYKETNIKESARKKNQVILRNGKVGTPGPLSRIVKFPGNHEAENFIRDSYRGGINEIFETEMTNPGAGHDANSMYPFAMKGPMPVGQPVMTRDIDKFSLMNPRYVYFVKCKVNVPDQMYPPLYILNDNILTSPVGEFVGTWYSPELVNAIDNFGVEIREIIMSVRFERCDDLFHKFIDTVYKIKSQQDEYKRSGDPRYSPALRDLTKLILNSGYGGFGMYDLVSKTRIVSPEEADRISELFPIEILKEFKDGNVLIGYKQVPNSELLSKLDETSLTEEEIHILREGIYGRTKVNIAIASAVTANARINLLNTGLAIRQNGGKVYKCATDSWYHEGDMPSHLVDTTGVLGLWKKEHSVDYGIFPGGNIYMLNPGQGKKEVHKIGSLHKDFKFAVTLSDLQNMLLGQPLEKANVHWSRPLFGAAESAVTIREGTIRLLPAVKKRIPIYEDGKWIGGAPIKLNGTVRVDYDYMSVWNNRYGPQPTGFVVPGLPNRHNLSKLSPPI